MEGTVNQDEALKLLADNQDQLTNWGKEFQASVSKQFAEKGTLTEKQWHFVFELANEIKAGKPEPVEVGDFTGVIELFAKAKQHLKFPTIVLQSADAGHNEIKIKPAGPASANVGMLYVYYDGVYRGKISAAGLWVPFKSTDQLGFIWAMLKALAKDPVGTAAAHGKLTGKCCFCNTKLTDPKSTSVGYGPVCAKHYDLPWGEPKTQPEITTLHKEEHQITKNELAGELIEEVLQEDDNPNGFVDGLVNELEAVFGKENVLTEADLQPPSLEDLVEENSEGQPISWDEAVAIEKEFRAERVKFDLVPGKAVKNLLEAMGVE
jgi:hypothetical protein